MKAIEIMTNNQFWEECMLPFFGRSDGSTAKKRLIWGEPRVSGTLMEAKSHFGPTQRGRESQNHDA